MYVCICKAVTESQIRQAVAEGARDLKQLRAATGCSSKCGCCLETAQAVLVDELRARGTFLRVVGTIDAA
ncbi:MAG: (2Fe-2S)-binding protein [Xanthomonadales bacterium]|nr:(2Fe-2S)-binding protein [Xanthomonadales bacterium]NIN58749.1 (2Fe-2S)-binding protein [Xanthomonadales bacterium]NIN74015.1 (2Fe-2S)-binding protein [Xanthomonadales bacterium]NIO12930.1 (2Fe-2S)-binding protein [Xanthomonadales bacterium]NIP11142.1 (2Fe-2S)-binding protein [Xanthomonadales bacterium]